MKRLSKFFLAVLLLTVTSVGWSAQTIDQWGKSHYDAYGKAEGRTLTVSGSYGDYVREYADLLAAYNAAAGSSTSGNSCYGDYVSAYPDLLAAYNASGGSQSIEAWGKAHYNAWGKAEGRTLPTNTATNPTVSLNCTPPSVTENGGIFTCKLLLSKPTSEKVTVKVSYSGTATKGTDYTDNYRNDNTTHPIAAGATSTSWIMTGISDTTTEGNETIIVAIDSVTNGTEAAEQMTTLELTE